MSQDNSHDEEMGDNPVATKKNCTESVSEEKIRPIIFFQVDSSTLPRTKVLAKIESELLREPGNKELINKIELTFNKNLLIFTTSV